MVYRPVGGQVLNWRRWGERPESSLKRWSSASASEIVERCLAGHR